MADWGQRAKDKDRDEAIERIEAAAARGQIVDVDKLKRIQEVRAAGTVGEIELITRGLGLPEPAAAVPSANPTFEPYSPPRTPPITEPDPSPPAPPHHVQYGEPLTPTAGTPITFSTATTTSGRGGKLVLLIVLIVLAGIAIPVFFGIKAVVDTAGDVIDDIEDLDPGVTQTADVISAEGLADLTSAIEEETGSSDVFTATLYPEYAVLEVPAESSGKRMIRYFWDGSLQEQGKGGASYPERFDLRDVDAKVLQRLLKQIRNRVEGANTSYAIVRAPSSGDEGAWLYAYASNEYSEGGYLSADLDGTVIRRVNW